MDLFRDMETALRTYRKRLLIDELLPPPEKIPSSLPDESSLHLPAGAAGSAPVDEPGFTRGNLRERLEKMDFSDQDEKAGEPGGGNLQDEVQEFLAHQKSRGAHGAPEIDESPSPSEENDDPDRNGESRPTEPRS